MCQAPCRDVVIGPLVDKPFQRHPVSCGFVLANRLVVAKVQAAQVGIGKGVPVGVVGVERQQLLEQPDRFQFRRAGIGRCRTPFHERGDRPEYRAVGRHDKSILRQQRALLAGLVELQRFVDQEIIQGRAVTVRHRTFLQ